MLYRKPDSPFWWADIRVAGRRYRISTKERAGKSNRPSVLAQQKEAALIHQLSTGESTGIRKRAPILRDYAKDFLDYVGRTRRSEETKDYYRNGWRLLERETISGMRIDAITTATAEVLAIPGSGSNVNCALRTLRRMLSLAEEKNLILKRPRIHMVEEVERVRLVEAKEEEIILAKAPRTLRDAYLLIADLGIRPNDAVALKWEDVDFVRGDVFIAGGKTGKKAQRYLPMSSRVREMLVGRARMGNDWIFPSHKGHRAGQSITPHSVSSRFSTFKRQMGFPKELVLYSARHTFATDITEATGNLSKTQKALGHTSLSTTARYNHSRSADIAVIMDARNSQRHVLGHGTNTVQ